jgi:hypothetical protein
VTGGDPDTPYGGIAENELVAADGTTPWRAVTETTAAEMSLEVLQNLRSAAKISDGRDGKPNVAVTTEALYNKIRASSRCSSASSPTTTRPGPGSPTWSSRA